MRVNPKVAVVCLNFENWQDTIECLESLQQIRYHNYQTILVDNYSRNESVDKIREWVAGTLRMESKYVEYRQDLKPVYHVEYDRVTAEQGGIEENEMELSKYPSNRRLVIIQTGKNLGFSGGNNVGARYAIRRNYDYIITLNNDTIVSDGRFISKIINVFSNNIEAKVVGPKIITQDGKYDGPYVYETFWGEFFLLSLRNLFHKLTGSSSVYVNMRAIQSQHPTEVYKISGACMAFDSKFLAKVGYFDENVWLSCEEAILSEKVVAYGGKIFFQPLTSVIHKKATAPRSHTNWYNIMKNYLKQREYFLKNYRKYRGLKLALIKLVHKIRLFSALLQSRSRRY